MADTVKGSCLCGSGLFGEPDSVGGVGITLASMSGPIDREPECHIFWDDRAPWVRVADDLPRFGGPTGVEPLS
jgi:hypothetical protein